MFIKHIVILYILCGLLSCAGPNSAPDGGGSDVSSRRTDCIFRSSIRGYSVLVESNLIIDASGRRKYHVALRRRAYGLRSSWGIGFDSPSGQICASFSEVVFEGRMNGDSIRIASIRELSPEDHEDLLIQYGKKKPEIEQTPAPRDVKGAEVEELDLGAADDSSGN